MSGFDADTAQLLEARNSLLRAAGWASVLVALLLLLVKLGAWWVTQSASVLASLVDSIMDLASSSLNLFALRYAVQPADDEHRFGHGKAEALGAFAQSIFLAISALGILVYAGDRLLAGAPLQASSVPLGQALMVLVLVITGALVLFQSYVIRRTESQLVSADSLHYRSDFLINGSVLVALFFADTLPWLDGVFAIGIALYVGWSALHIGVEAVNELLDRELPEEIDSELLALARQHGNVVGVHGLKTRRAGGKVFIQMDLEFDGQMSLAEAHGCSLEVKDVLLERYPQAEIIIHMDPVRH